MADCCGLLSANRHYQPDFCYCHSVSGKDCIDLARVLYVCACYPQARGVKWVSSFRDSGFDVVVFRGRALKGGEETWARDSTSILIQSVGPLSGKFPVSLALARRIARLAASHKPDLVLVRDIFLAWYAFHAAKSLNIPCYVDIADNYPEVVDTIVSFAPGAQLGFHLLNGWERYVLVHAHGIVTVSQESKARIMKKHGLPDSKIFVVENAPRNAVAYAARGREFAGNLVYIGTYDHGIRDLDTVVKGMREYCELSGGRIHLTIYAFEQERVRSMLRGLGDFAELVTVVPAVPNSMLHEALRRYDAGIVPHCRCPATEYTVPNKLYDYLYSGIPVICSDSPPLKRVLDDVGGGVIYSAGDPLSFSQSVLRLREMIDKGQGRVDTDGLISRYSWSVQVEPFIRNLHGTLT